MNDPSKIVLTRSNAGTLSGNPWFREGMTLAEYEKEADHFMRYWEKHRTYDGCIPSWAEKGK